MTVTRSTAVGRASKASGRRPDPLPIPKRASPGCS